MERVSAASPVEVEPTTDSDEITVLADAVGDDRLERPGQPDVLRHLRVPEVLRLRQEEGREADARGAPRRQVAWSARAAARRWSATCRRCTSTASGRPWSKPSDVSGFARHRRSERRHRHLHRLRGRPAALAGRPAGRAAAQRGGGARATTSTRSRRCSTSPGRPPSRTTRCWPGCSRRPTATTRRPPAEFRRFTEGDLRDGKAERRRHVIDAPRGGRAAARARPRTG